MDVFIGHTDTYGDRVRLSPRLFPSGARVIVVHPARGLVNQDSKAKAFAEGLIIVDRTPLRSGPRVIGIVHYCPKRLHIRQIMKKR
jgi:hypothetical protein